jgi:hypothetical protein
MGYVVGGKVTGETWIEARGIKHRLIFSVNQIKQEPIVKNLKSRSHVTTGTRITVFWPATDAVEACKNNNLLNLLNQYVWVNPHLTLQFVVDGEVLIRCDASNPNWTKYRPCDATSAHWYALEQFERYAGALVARDQEQQAQHPRGSLEKTTVRDFVAQFRGMSATEKQKEVLREFGASHMSLLRFFGSEAKVNHEHMEKMLRLLQKHTRPVRPELLGVIGEEHLRRMCESVGGEPQSFKYCVSPGHDASGVPYVVEIAVCPFKQWVAGGVDLRHRKLVTGVNFSATLENPFQTLRGMEGLEGILTDLRAGWIAPVIVCVHYASPHIEYLDRGKSRIGLE